MKSKIFYLITFLCLLALPLQAGEKFYEADLSSSTTSTGTFYRPNPGDGSIAITFSSGASGTMYLERLYTGTDTTATPVWEQTNSWTENDARNITFRGSRQYKYQFRADMSSGTVYGFITQDDRDRDR